jgi:hypothetical protein
MHFAEFKKRTARTNVLSAIDILGSFDFYTSIVSLDSLVEQDIAQARALIGENSKPAAEAILTPAQFAAAKKVLPLAIHEYTHFIDASSTVWGLEHLRLMNEAYLCSDIRGGHESSFLKAKTFNDHARRIRLPNYYTTVEVATANTRPWQSRITVGKLFNSAGELADTPILFGRFANERGEALARSPVSTVSLLEASAMAQELQFEAMLIQLTEEGFRLVEERQFASRTLVYLYNPQITEYSVCAHILANAQQCPDILVTFGMCAILTRIALNFTPEAFLIIADTCPVAQLIGTPEEHTLTAAFRRGLVGKDRGMLYYLLCQALPENSHKDWATFQTGVSVAVERLGLRIEEFERLAREFVASTAADLIVSDIKSIGDIARAGAANYQLLPTKQHRINFSSLHLPPAMLGDSNSAELFNSPANTLSVFDIDRCFEELYAGQSWVERFSEACV